MREKIFCFANVLFTNHILVMFIPLGTLVLFPFNKQKRIIQCTVLSVNRDKIRLFQFRLKFFY